MRSISINHDTLSCVKCSEHAVIDKHYCMKENCDLDNDTVMTSSGGFKLLKKKKFSIAGQMLSFKDPKHEDRVEELKMSFTEIINLIG
jgi:hypothetical protein